MGGGGGKAFGSSGFSPALRCLIRQWRALEPWISSEEAVHRYSHHALTALRDVMTPRQEAVIVSGTFGEWSPITIHLDGEISVRDRSAPYKGAMFAVYPGDIVFSKIDARSGAIGMLPASIPKGVVTPEFPVFVADPAKLDSGFVQRVLRTGGFLKALRSKATGTSGRKRISPEAFLDLRIPLPNFAEQQAIIVAFDAALKDAAAKEQAAIAVEAKAMADFEAALGFAPATPLPDKPVFIASFKDLDRWSHEGVLRGVLKLTDPVPAFPVSPLGTVGRVSYGLQKYPGNRPGLHARPYLRVANVQRNRVDLQIIKTINVPDEDMPKYRLEEGDLLLCEGNSAELVGRGAIWRNEIADCVHQNHVLRVRLDQSRATPEFALSVINSSYGQAYFRTKAKQTTNLASINSKEVASFPLPLPPLAEQKSMIAKLDDGMAEAARLRCEAAAARASAWAAFEGAVYAEEPAA
jgi:type I restriction enzyme S subunit